MFKLFKDALFFLAMATCGGTLAAQTAPSVYAPHRKTQTPSQQAPTSQPQAPASQSASPRVNPSPYQPIQPTPAAQPKPSAAQPSAAQASTAQQGAQPQVTAATGLTPGAESQPQAQSAAFAPKVPASAPRVTFQNGELTVIADNSSLGEVLNSVRAATGMKIEGPSGGGERVTAQIGPAPVRDVLLSLLEGSHYDFAMLGAASDPQKIERLVLTPRLAATNSSNAAPQQQQQPEETEAQPASSDDDDNEGFAEPAKPAPATTTPPAQVKTPEQLLEDLKKIETDKAQQQAQPTQPADPNTPRPTRPDRPK